MRHNWFSMLPERAFQKKIGSNAPATLEGGGGGIVQTIESVAAPVLDVVAVATGNPELVPLISAGTSLAEGQSLCTALEKGAISAVTQGVGSAVACAVGALSSAPVCANAVASGATPGGAITPTCGSSFAVSSPAVCANAVASGATPGGAITPTCGSSFSTCNPASSVACSSSPCKVAGTLAKMATGAVLKAALASPSGARTRLGSSRTGSSQTASSSGATCSASPSSNPLCTVASFTKGTQIKTPGSKTACGSSSNCEALLGPLSAVQNPVQLAAGIEEAASGGVIGYASGGALCTDAGFTKGTQVTVPDYAVTCVLPTSSTNQTSSLASILASPAVLDQEIQSAAGGGLINLPPEAEALYASKDPMFTRGERSALFRPAALVSPMDNAPHFASGGDIPVDDTRPQFYSEGGLQQHYVQGGGDGTSDSVPARLAKGEFVLSADVVSALGNGSNEAGAHVLDQFMKTIREHKQSKDGKLPKDSKGPMAYLLQANKKVKK